MSNKILKRCSPFYRLTLKNGPEQVIFEKIFRNTSLPRQNNYAQIILLCPVLFHYYMSCPRTAWNVSLDCLSCPEFTWPVPELHLLSHDYLSCPCELPVLSLCDSACPFPESWATCPVLKSMFCPSATCLVSELPVLSLNCLSYPWTALPLFLTVLALITVYVSPIPR